MGISEVYKFGSEYEVNMEDFSFDVAITCPTCGCTEFAYENPAPGQDFTDDWPFTCAHCGRTFTREQLIEGNSESIDAAVSDMGDDIVASLSKDLEAAFKKQGWKIK